MALSIVLNSVQCGPRDPNPYEPKGYLVKGVVVNLTATGPVGAYMALGQMSRLQVLDWTGGGTSNANFPTRLSADPPATRLITHYESNNSADFDVTPLVIRAADNAAYSVGPTFRISC